jgi:methionyl-tRNA formyltransferase
VLRVGFAGTPDFAARTLAALHEAGCTIPLVLTQPDRPHGRGLKLAPSPVKAYAEAHGLTLAQPASLKTEDARAGLLAVALDVLVVAAYGLILPRAVLAWPRHGCLNIHASLLPRWRGAAPIARAIEAGDATSGVTIMQMDAGLDTGPTVTARQVAIGPRETAGSLHDTLAAVGAEAIVQVLAVLARDGRLDSRPQPEAGVTYARKIEPGEAAIDWRLGALPLDRRIRALDPAPGAFTALGGVRVKVSSALPVEQAARAEAGTVVAVGAAGVDVACGEGALRLVSLKPAGGRAMSAAAFAAGRALAPGARFDVHAVH